MSYSTQVREYGAYVSARSPADAPTSWTLSTGAIGSYDAGQLDREFGFVSGAVSHPVVSLYALQELDYNRGWKRAFDPALTPTSTYLSLRVRATDALTLHTGYDTRRSVRLYRNYVTPEIAFDDAFRTGVWGGVLARLGSIGTASLDARHSSGGIAGEADIYSLSGTLRRSWTVPLEFRARSSWYDTPVTTGWLHSTAVAADARDWLRLEASGGARIETPRPGTAIATTVDRLTVSWLELNGDVAIGRAWYVQLSFTRERGGWDSADLAYTALSYRF
jgi:hypothetical protein